MAILEIKTNQTQNQILQNKNLPRSGGTLSNLVANDKRFGGAESFLVVNKLIWWHPE